MKQRRGVLALVVLSMFASSSTLILGQGKDEKKKDEAQKKEIANIVKIVDDLAAGQSAPNDFGLSWLREDVLKAQGNKEYVPFTVQIDPSKAAAGTARFDSGVGSKNPAAPAAVATDGKKDDCEDKDKDKYKGKCSQSPYEGPAAV